ncbi:hypothetical protein CYLTODRAFT_106105 [Cylindrobasidium torrendii FP15055 ss-10]|uniref:Uncharacterized protein n=1 Tax=Cylindrobasidium torrendii FP15055 ss-10 TaxID=1314674 RepID=A0A0D7B2B8_9AGAR|nr:hypothetical protein CYLTODRAFT_106105 [Cylindrobasidium torrendii FP15055 ss-10]
MVLLLSDAGSVNKPEDRENFHRLSSASSTTLAASPAHRISRVSRRAVLVLLFHGSLILITTALLVVSIFRWEHRLSVDGGKSSNLSSYIYLGTQTFFTGVVLLLYETSRSIAVDAAIRHPHTLIELNNRIAAWSGLPAAVFNWFSKSPSPEHGSRLRRPYRSTYIGIPLYLIAGFVLQLSASGIFGINLYDHPTTSSNIQYAAVSHSGNYGMNYAADTATSWRDSRFLWEAARAEVFLAKVNHTDWPGLQEQQM